ncbi:MULTISPECIES: autotransporter outer membrane beta-barrel domain-containing protein [unclassified Snodgrassella]|uniref:autotransporter outer membrane beta-barrel domain-containing protein n=1 Tax=unclassified Snodgrassella TaxID=2625236 RepID=UPI0018DCA4AD|nr:MULTISPECIES: autotransporter outer membrane beta-barrel domain-containing protein [unclassified Snodgrassella]MBI0068700.1 autotransporter outer membrane beta-barrel domain-containing protein [Snodgrassella sp. M0110]MBI0077759.1 autotransporter outer membrane beta-barrel domain-containing protein [Snodgrassella sp. M0118]MBI0080119.1 autotransporter outer membrane beta-barrel domain-containing protein [Snodgrassella sp. M0112]
MNNFKQKKLNSIIHTLIFKLSLGTLALLPVSVNADTSINDTNIGNYKTTGININDNVNININTTNDTAPHIDIDQNSSSGMGLAAASDKNTTINGGLFKVKGRKSNNYYNSFFGIYLSSRSNLVSNSDLDIDITSGRGMYLPSEGNGEFNGKVTIKGQEYSPSGDYNIGISAYNSSRTKRTTGTFNDEVNIKIEGTASIGIASQKVESPNVAGSELIFNDKVNIDITTKPGTIKSGNKEYTYYGAGIAIEQISPLVEDSDGIDRGDVMKFNKGLNLTIKGGTAILMDQHKGKLEINDGSNGNRIVVQDPKDFKAIEATAGKVTINGKSEIIGDIVSSENDGLRDKGVVNLTLTDGSMLLSSLDNDGGAGEINLGLSGSHSQWKMTSSSNINTLKLADDAKVRFGYDYATPDTATRLNQTNAMTLTADSLEGNGIFEMRTAIGKFENHDVLKITGSGQATGDHKIMVNDAQTGDARVDGSETFRLVETEGGDANFTLATPYVDVGAFKYNKLSQVTDRGNGSKDWVLSTSSNSQTPELSDTAQEAANILNTNYLMNYVETQTLLQRMGQIRTDDTASGKVWGRIYTGKLSSFNDNRLSGFDMDYYGLQLGLDRKLNYDKVNLYYGVMGGLSRGEVDHNVGDGSTKSYSLGLYGTLQSQNGFYLDGLVKYMHMTNKFNSMTAGGYHVKGDGNTNGFSIGAEVGKRIHLSGAGNADEGWYLEPQAQLTYSHQDGATINATNGLSTRLASYNSLIGRASLILGYTIQSGKNPVDVYFKTGYQKEFDGETSYTFNRTVKEKYKFDGNWWDNGIGVNMRLNRNHHIYGDMVYSAGNKFNQKQINAGYRYNF